MLNVDIIPQVLYKINRQVVLQKSLPQTKSVNSKYKNFQTYDLLSSP